jgi:SAM-dependent methyltransferase
MVSAVKQLMIRLGIEGLDTLGSTIRAWPGRMAAVSRNAILSPASPTTREDAGVETLRRMASVDKYNEWIFRRIEAHVGDRILEVGCGLGNMTPFFLGRELLVSMDVLPASISQVRELYGAQPRFHAVEGDILQRSVVEGLRPHRFDTVVCLNVLEHIREDCLALRNMAELLQPGGRLILFLPAGQYLYGRLDAALLHFRRYDRRSLTLLAEAAGLKIRLVNHMNPAGIPGWFLASKVLRRSSPPRGLLSLFNVLTPLLVRLEESVEVPLGLSLVCVLENR